MDKTIFILIGALLLVMMLGYAILPPWHTEAELKFNEIHGTETNSCWCPDDCTTGEYHETTYIRNQR